MRFVLISWLIGLGLCAISLDANSQVVDLNIPPAKSDKPQIRKSQNSQNLKTTPEFLIQTLTTGLNDISALAFNPEDNTVYTAEKSSGRIWKLTDRNGDGRIDMKSALAHRFDTPSGLAIFGKDLYVSDRNAVWHIQNNQPPIILAGLRNAKSIGSPHPLSITQSGDRLFLGVTTQDGEVKILSLDTQTGEANLSDQLQTDKTLRAFGSTEQTPPWVVLDNAIGSDLSSLTEYNQTYEFGGLALPPSSLIEEMSELWPSEYTRHVFASLHSGDGFSVVAIPAAFGKPQNKAKILLTGFVSSTKLTAWGEPSLLLFSNNGLIIADPVNGSLYQLSTTTTPTPPVQKSIASETDPITTEEATPSITPPSTLVSTITGSQIKSASTLTTASGIEVGSTIIRDFKPLTLEKEDETEETSKTEADK